MRKMIIVVLTLLSLGVVNSFGYETIYPLEGSKRGLYADPASFTNSLGKLWEAGQKLGSSQRWLLQYNDENVWQLHESINQPYDYMIFEFLRDDSDQHEWAHIRTQVFTPQSHSVEFYVYDYDTLGGYRYWDYIGFINGGTGWVTIPPLSMDDYFYIPKYPDQYAMYIMAVAFTLGDDLDYMNCDIMRADLYFSSNSRSMTGFSGEGLYPENECSTNSTLNEDSTMNINSSSLGKIKATYK